MTDKLSKSKNGDKISEDIEIFIPFELLKM